MKKKDLRDGDIVKLRGGGEYEVHTNGCFYFISGFDKKNYFELPLCFYNDDLTFRLFTLTPTSGYDIIKVSQMWRKGWAHSQTRKCMFGTYWDWNRDKENKETKRTEGCIGKIQEQFNKNYFKVGGCYTFNNYTKNYEIKEKENNMKDNMCLPCRMGDRVTSSDGKSQIIGGYQGEDVCVRASDNTEIIKIERPTDYETIYEAPKEPKFKVGDIVEVTSHYQCFSIYDAWFKQNNCEYLSKYYKGSVNSGFIGEIVKIGIEKNGYIICAIRNRNEVYLVGEEDIKKTDKKLDILNTKEKEYLSAFIKPFRDRVRYITKTSSYISYSNSFIQISIIDNSNINLPYFDKKSMYNGMEIDKNYTLKELGL